jgi:hypothetical protein
MDIQIRKRRLSENLKLLKEKILKADTEDEKKIALNELDKLQQELNILETGINLEISETQPGRFRIARDYDVDNAENKKLKRLSR